jgi:hypothetical protein
MKSFICPLNKRKEIYFNQMEKQTSQEKRLSFTLVCNCQQADIDHAKENYGAVIDVNFFPYL